MTAKINCKDWRNLALSEWNVATFHAYFADMNRECYGVETYLPWRNWGAEQRMIKAAITQHGAATLKAAFDECFRTYRPTRDYPMLTAGFAVGYLVNGIIPRLQAEEHRKVTAGPANGGMSTEEVEAWL